MRSNKVLLDDSNIKEFLDGTKVLGPEPYYNPYVAPEIKIVTPLTLYKTYNRELRLGYARRFAPAIHELKNPKLALGPRRNIVLKCAAALKK